MIKKRILCAFLALLICGACATPVFAEPEESENELTPLPEDPDPKEKVWADFETDEGGWSSSDLAIPMNITTDPTRGRVASLEVNRYYQDAWRGLLQNFSPALDLFYYRELSFDCLVSPIADENARYFARLIVRDETSETEYRSEITAGEWNEVVFDISGLAHRHEISNIEISFAAQSTNNDKTIESISVDDITLGQHMHKAVIDRYAGENFTAYGAEFDYSEEGYFSLEVHASAPTLELDIFVRDPEEKNAALFILDVKDECKKISLYYADEKGDFSSTRSLSLEAESGKRSYVFPMPSGVTPKRIKLVFEEARSGRIDVYSSAMVSVFSPGIQTFGEINHCEISSDKRSIVIKGSVQYDTARKYAGEKLELFALETYENEDDIAQKEPIATADMSSRFEFYLAVSDTPWTTQRYVVVVKDDEGGETVFIDHPKYITNFDIFAPAKATHDPASIKGMLTDSAAKAKDADASQVVLDVYINKIITEKSTGYLHTVGSSYYYYDMDYVHALDLEVKQYCNTGVGVYLRLLMQDDAGNLVALRTSSKESATRTAAAVDFLSSHYNGADTGRIAGFIVGEKIDLATSFNGFGKMSLSDYVREYVRTLRLVYNTAALNDAAIRVAVPLSDSFLTEDYSDAALFGGAYDKKLLISGLCSAISLGGELDWLLVWENEEFFLEEREDKICASNYYMLDRYLDECKKSYPSAPASTLFFFEPEGEFDADTLGAIYAYSYYTFLFEKNVDGFFVKIKDADLQKALLPIIKYIDTEKGAELTSTLLSFFGAGEWNELVAGYSKDALALIKLSESRLAAEAPEKIIGSAALWNFSAAHSLLGWENGCRALSSSYSRDGDIAFLLANFETASSGSVIYPYDTPEDLSLFDYLSFELQVTDPAYESTEVSVSFGGNGFLANSGVEVKTGEKTTLYFDLSNLPKDAKVKYIELSLSNTTDATSLMLYRVDGHSTKLDSDALTLALEAPRGSDEVPRFDSMWIVIMSTVAIASVVAVVAISKKERTI